MRDCFLIPADCFLIPAANASDSTNGELTLTIVAATDSQLDPFTVPADPKIRKAIDHSDRVARRKARRRAPQWARR
jgi:hypothetical protein